jgi:hypothetical protein
VKLFHVHIPKTAGTSLNGMLERYFGNDFCNHNIAKLQEDKGVVAAASHTTLGSALNIFPNAKLVTVLRSPEARLKSTIRHLYARKSWPAYSDIGPVISELIDDKGYFKVDNDLLANDIFRERFDNLQVRYLSLEKVGQYVESKHLDSAKSSVSKLYAVLLQETFDSDSQKLMESLGEENINIMKENKAKSQIPLWDTMPEELLEYIKYDNELYEFVSNRG